MAEHAWTVLCSRAITDNETNQVSLIDVVENIGAGAPADFRARRSRGEKIAVPFSWVLASLWVRSDNAVPESSKCRAALLDPLGREALLEPMSFDIDLTTKERLRTHLKATALPIHGEGRYTFQVDLLLTNGEWKTVARVPFEVRIVIADKPGENEKAPKKSPRRPRAAAHRRK